MNTNSPFYLKSVLVTTAAALALALTGCSSVTTHIDKGAIAANTFSFVDPGRRPVPSSGAANQAHALVQQALGNTLAAKGVRYVQTGGDVTVAYLVVVGNSVSTEALDSYFGYSEDSEKFLSLAHSQPGEENRRGYFEAGTLVIDFVDPHTSKVLQRRMTQAEVLRDQSAQQRAQRIQGIVDQALHDVPVVSSAHR